MRTTVVRLVTPVSAGFRPRARPLTSTFARCVSTKGQPSPKPPNSREDSSQSSSPQNDSNTTQSAGGSSPPKPPSMEDILASTNPEDNSLLAPVHVPEDPNGVLKSDHPSVDILTQSGIVVQRHLELMNILGGIEQANRYVILDPHGNHIGYMAEHNGGFGKAVRRQMFRTHRPFTTHVFDRNAREVLRFDRPFSWINSRIRVYDALESTPVSTVSTPASPTLAMTAGAGGEQQQISHLPLSAMRIIGESQSEWAPLRRKYSLYLSHDPRLGNEGPGVIAEKTPEHISQAQMQNLAGSRQSPSALSFAQFAAISEPFLSWDFSLLDEQQRLIGSVNRSFRGFAREIFTDTGSYALRMDSAGLEAEAKDAHLVSQTHRTTPAYSEALGGQPGQFGMTLDQRAVMLATAVTIDYDYFSRHSTGSGLGFFPFWIGGGGEAAGGAAGAAGAGEAAGGVAAAGEAGAIGVGRAVGSAGTGIGAGEGAMAGAGTMAGYEAMQRGLGRDSQAPADSPADSPSGQPYDPQSPQSPYDSQSPQSNLDGQEQSGDVWGSAESDPWSGGAGDSGGGDGDGWLQWLWNMFFGD